jgi:very-short-patch-repair endonuclease
MTEAEWRLWQALRGKRFEGYKFRRQVPVGSYVADFQCFDRRLIVELDGSHHLGSARDARRDAWLAAQGFRVLRFPNIAVFEALDGTLLAILDALKEC